MRFSLPKAMEVEVKAWKNTVMAMAKVKAASEGEVSSRVKARNRTMFHSHRHGGQRCEWCRYTSHYGKSSPASCHTCTACGKRGHFLSVCKIGRTAAQDAVTFQESNYQFSCLYARQAIPVKVHSDPDQPWRKLAC